MSYNCEFCPKLCHHACPVGEVSHDEALNTWGKVNTLASIDQKKLSEDNYAVAYQCVQCHASETACEINTPATSILHTYRVKAFKKGLAPGRIQQIVEDFLKIRLYVDTKHQKTCDVLYIPSYNHNSIEDPDFENRIQKAKKLFEKFNLEVDFLTSELPCCGYTYYAAGDEKSFTTHAHHQRKFLRKYKTIVSDSAMCLEMFSQYQKLGDRKLLHLSEFLLPLIKKISSKAVTYHDPCYLGRHRQTYSAPREVLKRATGLAPHELRRHHEMSYCCGGGGLFPITSPKLADQMTQNRLKEFLESKTSLLVTGCPTCVSRFKEVGTKQKTNIGVMDLIDFLLL